MTILRRPDELSVVIQGYSIVAFKDRSNKAELIWLSTLIKEKNGSHQGGNLFFRKVVVYLPSLLNNVVMITNRDTTYLAYFSLRRK